MGPVAAVRDDRGYFGYELRTLVVPAEGTAFAVPPYSLRLLDCYDSASAAKAGED